MASETSPSPGTSTGSAALEGAKQRFSRNAAFNAGAALVDIVVGFVIVPLVVHGLGEVSYGIWVLVGQGIAGMGLADFGMSITVVRFLAQHNARDDRDAVQRLMSTSLLYSFLPAVLVLCGGGLFAVWAPQWFHLPAALVFDTRLTIAFMATALALNFPAAVLNAAIPACSRYDYLAWCKIVLQVLRAVLYWAVLAAGWGLAGVAAAALASEIVSAGLGVYLAHALLPWLRLSRRAVSWETLRPLLGFSVYAFLLMVAVQAIFGIDNLVVGWALGPVAVAFYGLAAGLAERLRASLKVVTTLYAPLAAQMHALERHDEMRQLFLLGSRLTLLLVMPACLGLCLLGPDFLQLWVGASYRQHSSAILILLAAAVAFFALDMPCTQVLYGMGRHRFNALLSCAEGGANLVLSLILVRFWGGVGVAWGSFIPALVCEAFILPAYTLRHIQLKPWPYYRSVLLRPLAVAAPAAGWFLAWHESGWVVSWFRFAATVLGGLLVYMWALRAYGIGAEESGYLRRALGRLPPVVLAWLLPAPAAAGRAAAE
ncbi:MAG TPA: polysaccharide biosynthesis C-terminal domain-containing protein [Terriglobales bacterium]|jgi:O-antigen/teichoic acid export membrane protein